MVAARDDIDAGSEELLGSLWSNSRAPCGVLAVGHDHVEPVLLAQPGDQFLNRASSWLPYDVGDKEKLHRDTLPARNRGASG